MNAPHNLAQERDARALRRACSQAAADLVVMRALEAILLDLTKYMERRARRGKPS